jgi:hypothetical protein
VQGKAAFGRIFSDIESDYFPIDTKHAVEVFKTGPLARARQPLVRNLIIALSKELLMKGWKELSRARRHAAVSAILEMYVQTGEVTLANLLPGLVSTVPDDTFYRVVFFVGNVERSWDAIGSGAQIKVRNYITDASKEDAYRFLPYALRVPALRELALQRLAVSSAETLERAIRKQLSADYIPMALLHFEKANSFRDAERLCEELILPLAPLLTAADIGRVINAFLTNMQIKYAARIPELYLKLFEKNLGISDQTRPEWQKMLEVLQSEGENFFKGSILREALVQRYGASAGEPPATV